MTYANPAYLTSVDELAEHLEDDNLRLFDTNVILEPDGHGYRVVSGYDGYLEGHVPGAGFIDLGEAWADSSDSLRFTLPSPDALQAAIGASGINASHRVVLYSSGHLMWATRAWWLLHHAGHQRVSVLNGNLGAWKARGLALESGACRYEPTTFDAAPVAGTFADTAEVAAGMHGRTCTLNALSQALYEGTGDFFYQRRGHIPGSRPLYFNALLDGEHFLPADALSEALQAQGATPDKPVITYCGGGIAATLNAFACKLLGYEQVAVYDGSMSEWVQDPERPLTTGPAP